LLARGDGHRFILASIVTIAGALPIISGQTLRAYVAAVVLTLGVGAFYRNWLGGLTGDLIGAAGEIVETAVLLAMTA
jgi:cobalamin synthase